MLERLAAAAGPAGLLDRAGLERVALALTEVTAAQLAGESMRRIDAGRGTDVVLADSYLHPNGFVRIALPLDAHVAPMRLHVFDRTTPGDVHNHRWPYLSVVLRGEVIEEVFEPGDGGHREELRHLVHRQSEDRQNFELVSGDLVPLHRARILRRSRGDQRIAEPRTLHRVCCAAPSAVTLMVQGAQAGTETDVYTDDVRSGTFRSDRFTLAEVRRILEQVAAAG